MKNIVLNYLLVCCFTLFSFSLTAQDPPPSNCTLTLQNVATGKFLTGATSGSAAVTLSDSGNDPSTHFTFVQSGSSYNIDSEILGILRAPGAGGPAGAYVVVSTTKASPAADSDKIWTIYHNATEDTYRFESNTAGRFMYHEPNNTVTHAAVPDTDDRSNWKLIPILTVPDEDTNPDLTCPASGEFQNDNTRNVDITSPVNVGTADDRTCYADYSESTFCGETWGVYNITDGSNHWDDPNTLQPRIERSLCRSGETGVGSYARFTGTLRILEVGDAAGTNNDGTYLMQSKGKHTGGGGSQDPAICLYLAKPVYGDDGNGNQVQVSFDIYREQINFRGGSGATGRTLVFLKNVLKNEIVDIELEVGFRTDPSNPNLKIHYSDAVIGGEVFNWDIPEPERGVESGIRYGAYRVKGGRAQMRWANTTYEKNEVVDNPENIVKLKNLATGEFLTAGGGGAQPVSMSTSGGALNTLWTLVESGAYFNIDSESTSGGTGILRATGADFSGGAYMVVSTTTAAPVTDIDKTWAIHYNADNNTYRFESVTSTGPSGRYLYQEVDGTVTHIVAPETDNRSVWQIGTCEALLPLDFISLKAQNKKAGIQLNWEIANEVNNNYFEILKGNDLNDFQSIGRIENESGQKYYQFLDRRGINQTHYYKIKQVDFDGKFSFSKVISVKPTAESVVLYPNPVRQNEDLTIESQHGYQIFNSTGMLLKSGTEKTIRMDLEKGIYFLIENNSSKGKRFIVN